MITAAAVPRAVIPPPRTKLTLADMNKGVWEDSSPVNGSVLERGLDI